MKEGLTAAEYSAHAAILIAHGSVRTVGFQWLVLSRKLLKDNLAYLLSARWVDHYRGGGYHPAPPDIHTETTYSDCVELCLDGQANGLFEMKITLYDGSMLHGEPSEVRCVFVLADVCLAAMGLVSLTNGGGSSQTDLDQLLRRNLRYVAKKELERKADEAHEKQVAEEEDLLLSTVTRPQGQNHEREGKKT
jgi:hypothetical protein